MVFINDIHSQPPCLNSNLEETLGYTLEITLNGQKSNISSGEILTAVCTTDGENALFGV